MADMDKELLAQLGLDTNQDLKSLLEDLEGKQYEFFERLETTNDEHRKEELNGLLTRIDQTVGEIKAQMAAVDSGIIFDTGAPEVDPEAEKKKKKQEQKAKEKEKEAQMAAKVQELKQKEEARRQQEAQAAEEAKKAAEKKAEQEKAAEAPAPEKKAAPKAEPVQQPMSDLQQGLARYHKQNYTAAFPIFKQLAERNDPTAQYMLACMYKRGEGTASDHERAEFWMKKAADNGDQVAQFDYAIMQLADQGRDNAKTAVGISYLKRSGDQGYRDAMDRYVELVDKGTGGLPELKVARGYCTKLLPLTEDSYDKQKYEKLNKDLRARQRKIQRRRFGAAASSVVSTLGALILLAATVLIFAGYHQEFLRTLPFVMQLPEQIQTVFFGFWYPGSMAVSIAGLPDVLAWLMLPVQNALLMIALGWMLKGAGNKGNRNGFSTAVVRIGCAIRYLAIGGHIALCTFLETDVLANAYINLGAIIAVIIVGRIFGAILGKILGTKKV